MDAREDGVYITYSTGADTVTKKLGKRPTKMFSSVGNGTYDCTSIKDYNQLTSADFLVEVASWSSDGGARRTGDASYPQFGGVSASGGLSKSYNPASGQLTIGGLNGYRNSDTSGWVHYTSASITVNIYVIL